MAVDVNPKNKKKEEKFESHKVTVEDLEKFPVLIAEGIREGDTIKVPEGKLNEYWESVAKKQENQDKKDAEQEEQNASYKAEKKYIWKENVTHNGTKYNKGDLCSEDDEAVRMLLLKNLVEKVS